MKRAFVIAMACEADCVRPYLKPDDRLYVAGIGKVNAAAATQKAICEGAEEVWNFGLAGGIRPEMEVFGIYTVSAAVEYDFDLSVLNGTGKGVKDERDDVYIPASPLPNLTAAILATGDSFADDAGELFGAGLRDMEGAAIADICDKNGIAFHSVKCVSDVVGKGPMTRQFKENRERCLECLKNAASSLI